jgi:hypothetical protein
MLPERPEEERDLAWACPDSDRAYPLTSLLLLRFTSCRCARS